MPAPRIETHWDSVPAGTYCMNVVQEVFSRIPYTWTETVVYK